MTTKPEPHSSWIKEQAFGELAGLALKPPTAPCVAPLCVGGDVHVRCVCLRVCVCVFAWTQTRLNIKRLCVCARLCVRKRHCPEGFSRINRLLLFHLSPLLHVCPNTTRALFQGRKQILSARLLARSSPALHLRGSRSLLFLHVSDIIIAVRG